MEKDTVNMRLKMEKIDYQKLNDLKDVFGISISTIIRKAIKLYFEQLGIVKKGPKWTLKDPNGPSLKGPKVLGGPPENFNELIDEQNAQPGLILPEKQEKIESSPDIQESAGIGVSFRRHPPVPDRILTLARRAKKAGREYDHDLDKYL